MIYSWFLHIQRWTNGQTRPNPTHRVSKSQFRTESQKTKTKMFRWFWQKVWCSVFAATWRNRLFHIYTHYNNNLKISSDCTDDIISIWIMLKKALYVICEDLKILCLNHFILCFKRCFHLFWYQGRAEYDVLYRYLYRTVALLSTYGGTVPVFYYCTV